MGEEQLTAIHMGLGRAPFCMTNSLGQGNRQKDRLHMRKKRRSQENTKQQQTNLSIDRGGLILGDPESSSAYSQHKDS